MTDSRIGQLLGLVGIGLYLLLGVLYVGSGLVMPYPWAFGMWALWAGGFAFLVRVFSRRRPWTPAVPATGLGLWVLIVLLGEQLFGWTA